MLRRDQAYIGVLIDEIVAKASEEPYRMLTARVEHRLLLRADTADLRLSEIGRGLGLLGEEESRIFEDRRTRLDQGRALLTRTINPGPAAAGWARAHGTAELTHGVSLKDLLRRPELDVPALAALEPALADLPAAEAEELSLAAKYEGYIERARLEAGRLRELEDQALPPGLDYETIPNLSREAVEKLGRIRPETLGQAGRISGLSPADLLAILVFLRRK